MMTNGDNIRCMTDEQLIEYFYNFGWIKDKDFFLKMLKEEAVVSFGTTNEEWLRTLPTTEELAKAIMECVIAKSWMFNEQSILRWLKEKHK